MRCSLDVDLSEQLRPRKQPSTAQAAASQSAPGDSLLIFPTSSSCSPLFYLHTLQKTAHKLSDVRALQHPEGSSGRCHMQAPQAQKQQGGGMQSSSGYCTSAASRAARLRGWLHLRGSPGDGSAPADFRSGCPHATPCKHAFDNSAEFVKPWQYAMSPCAAYSLAHLPADAARYSPKGS